MFFQLIYSSKATDPNIPRSELRAIMHVAERNNQREEITGLLLYSKGKFIQVLEGEKEKVLKLYQTIESDPRNVGHIIVHTAELEERQFPQWPMGFRNIEAGDDQVNPEAYSDVFEQQISSEYLSHSSKQVVNLLLSFSKH